MVIRMAEARKSAVFAATRALARDKIAA